MKCFKRIEGKSVYLSLVDIEDAEVYTKWISDLSTGGRLNVRCIAKAGEPQIALY